MAGFEITLYRDILEGSQPIADLASNLAGEFGIGKENIVSLGDSGEARVALFKASGELANFMARRNSPTVDSMLADDTRVDTIGVGVRGYNLPGVEGRYRYNSPSYINMRAMKPTKFEGKVLPEELTRELLRQYKAADVAGCNLSNSISLESLGERTFKPISLVRFPRRFEGPRPTVRQVRYPKRGFRTRFQLNLGPIRMLISGIEGLEEEIDKETFGAFPQTNGTSRA